MPICFWRKRPLLCVSVIYDFLVAALFTRGGNSVGEIRIKTNDIESNFHLPYWASKSVKLLGNFTIPMMLLTLGVSLATLKVEYVRKSVLLAVLRLSLGLIVGWGVCEAFDLEGVMRGIVILQATMPVAVFNYMFAMQYNRQPQIGRAHV